MLIRQLGLTLSRTDLDNAVDRIADCLRRILLDHIAVAVNRNRDSVLDLAWSSLLNNLGFARLQIRVSTDQGVERSLFNPRVRRGHRLTLFSRLARVRRFSRLSRLSRLARVRRLSRLSRLARVNRRRRLALALGAHANLSILLVLSNGLRNLRIAYRLTVLELPGLGDFLLTELTGLFLDNPADFQVRVVLNEGVVRNLLRVLIRQCGLAALGRANLDDLVYRVADFLRGLIRGDLPVFSIHLNGVLDFALLTFLDDLGLTRLQLRVDPNLDLERSLFSPLDGRGCRLALGTDLDDLLDRLSHSHGFGLGIHNRRVLDGLSRGDLVLA